MRLGIAGYMGSGKSLSAKFLAERYGWIVIDGDREARSIMLQDKNIISQVGEAFSVIENGRINFSHLGSIVFANPQALITLNSIVHPPLLMHLTNKIDSIHQTTLLDAALLPIWPLKGLVDNALWLHTSQEQRIKRLESRTSFGKDVLVERCNMQESLIPEPKSRIWKVLDNCGNVPELYTELEEWGSRFA